MDIYDAAIKYKKMLDSQYRFLLAHKKTQKEVVVSFSEYEFFHLAGLHKLVDLMDKRKSSKYYFYAILNKKLTQEKIESSAFYNDMKDRPLIIYSLDTIFEDQNTVFKINEKLVKTSISAKYLLEAKLNNKIVELYLNKGKTNFFCISTFFKKYELGTGFIKQTILRKEKIENNNTIILYKR